MRRRRTEGPPWLQGWVRANGWVWRGNDYMECPVCAALVIIDAGASDKHTRSHGIDPKTQWLDRDDYYRGAGIP